MLGFPSGMVLMFDFIRKFFARSAERKRKHAEVMARPAWPGAKHTVGEELAYLRSMGGPVGPGHPWWEAAHVRKHQR